MRLKISYKVSKIPNSYRMMIVSLIKKALSDYDYELFEQLYSYNNTSKNKKSKDFVFSVFINDYKKVGDEFITDEISLNLSSPNKQLMIHLYNALLRLNEFSYNGDYVLKKKDIKIIPVKSVKSDFVIFKTMSPIVVKNKENIFLDIDNPEYIECLNYIIDTSLKNYRGVGLREPIELIPIDMKKVVVKESIKSFREKTSKNHIYINSYKGVFAIKGSVFDLNDIYMLGIGFRRNQGFGMIDIV